MYQLGAISLPVLVLRGTCGRSRALNGVNGHEKWGEEVPRLPKVGSGAVASQSEGTPSSKHLKTLEHKK